MPLRLTIAFSDNPRLDPLKDGAVKPQGIELDFVTVEPGTLFVTSPMTNSTSSRCRSLRRCWRSSGGTSEGGPVGIAGLFEPRSPLAQSLCQHGFGHRRSRRYPRQAHRCARLRYDGRAVVSHHLEGPLRHRGPDNVWFNGRTKQLSHAGALGLDKAGPVGVEHHWLTADQTLDAMLDRGEIDACTAIRPEPGYRRRSDRHRPLGRHADRRQPAPAQTAWRRRQDRRFRIITVRPGSSRPIIT